MAIDKRGERTYRIRLPLGYDGGTRTTYTETVHGTLKEALARHRDLQAELERGTLSRRSRRSLNEFLTDWLETAKGRLKRRTHQEYSALVARYIKEDIGRISLDKFTPISIQQFYNKLTKQGLSARTVRTVHTVLSQALKSAVRLRMLPYNPARDVDLPKHRGQKVMRSMDLPQAQAFLEATRSHRFGAVFRAAIELGCRPQEYCALEWPDLNWDTGALTITKAMVWPRGGGWVIETTKTEHSQRQLVLSPTLLEDLRAHRAAQLQQRLFMGPEWKGSREFIFTNSFGGPLNPGTLNEAFKDLLKSAGLPTSFRVYDLRHTAATLMLQAHTPPKVAAERLGHSTIRLTMDTYSHVIPSMQQEVASKFEGLLHGDLGHRVDTDRTELRPTSIQGRTRKPR